ncbi:serine/threonine protein phosphatase [Asanoa iriomotensis]|uniref:Serine/threonine protein phosphatase n=1 Tax=Asanoa iriomotensis TaxID=234613 RepID=A0ABQ4C8S3_9ACTN|nr:serine/threonine protein phosphatase [Asanoa iriomotensis]GIF59173.1 hypothetical protein Air01nite_52680 [Asanoa iriomotensis]
MRLSRHARASAALARRGDTELAALLHAAPVVAVGVGGGCSLLDVEGVPVFAKRIPITDRELDRPHSTANLFGLPTHCQYGIGGPGFGAWRELAANEIVTEAVLAGVTASFPLLHHWRVLPGRSPVAEEHQAVDAVVALMGGSPAVRERLTALAGATNSLVLFLEYVPRPLGDWLADDPVARATALERQLADITTFLRDHGLLHMDGHFENMRADGEQVFLTDFGLATSPHFDLSAAEREFVARHADHDAGYAAMRLVNWLVGTVCGVRSDGPPVARNAYVRRCATGDIPPDLPPPVTKILARHAPDAARMNAFYWRLFDGDVHTPYPV